VPAIAAIAPAPNSKNVAPGSIAENARSHLNYRERALFKETVVLLYEVERDPEDGVAETSTPVDGRSAVSATSDALAGPEFEMVAT
jgi:hypothetical protein